MAVSIITGKLGAGKTLYSVSEIVRHLAKGGTVCTNIAIKWDAFQWHAARVYGRYLEASQLVRLDLNESKNWHEQIPWGLPESPVLVVLDEIHLFFNSRDWKATHSANRDMQSFLTQSRKAGVDVWLIAQSPKTVDSQMRQQAQWELYVCSSEALALGPLGALPLKCFLVFKKDANSQQVVKTSWRRYDKRLFKCYDSFDMLDDTMRDLGRDRVPRYTLRRVPIWRRVVGSVLTRYLGI